jgi:hypothetical protein
MSQDPSSDQWKSDNVVGYRNALNEAYDRQYRSYDPPAQTASGGTPWSSAGSASTPTFSWTFAVIGAVIALGVASNNQAPNPWVPAIVVGILCGALHKFIKFLIVAFVILAIITAMNR